MATATVQALERRPLSQRIGAIANKYGLPIVLAIAPLFYAVQDLVQQGNLTQWGNDIFQGLSNGAIWALIALGYTLVYGIIELINFAHGDLFMIGSLTTVAFFKWIGLTEGSSVVAIVFGLLLTLVVGMLVCGSLNVMIERVAYKPLRNAPKLAPLITAVGFSFILQNVGNLWIGGSPIGIGQDLLRINTPQNNIFTVFGIVVHRGDLLSFGVMIPLVVGLTTFVAHSRLGKAMRATAQDPEAARLMGINVDSTIGLTFLLGGLMAGAAGLVYALYNTGIRYDQGYEAGLIAFTAAVMGGIGNLRGAVLGGLIIGVIQYLFDDRVGQQWTSAIVFGYLILIMVFRPQGLLGEETREAG